MTAQPPPSTATEQDDGKPFATFLLEQAGGKTHTELTDNLRDLVAKVKDTGKKGTLTLTVSIAPMKGDASMLVVSDEIKMRPPEHDRKASIFWPDNDGNLLRNDPNQRSFWDEVAHAESDVNPTTGEVK